MQAEIVRHALDRVPLSLIIDDSTVLVNLNYFFMRDRNLVDGRNRRWEDVPVVHPEAFTRQFAEFCLEAGVRGKFSVVPCPAALGGVDEGLPLFSAAQQEGWLAMCREIITPAFDITPEMLTHTWVVDLETFQPVPEGLWEQYEWETLPVDQPELVRDYIATSCRILCNVGLPPEGVTSPGGFGGRTLEFYARIAGEAVRHVTGNPTPYFFKRMVGGAEVDTPVWYADAAAGTAVGEVIASADDRTGSWTGYGEVSADYYIGPDLQQGRLPQLIDAGQPAILCSHWQGFYGMHNEDRAGFRALKTVVGRLAERDPARERTRWRKCSEITNYACARAMATLATEADTIRLQLPVRVPELTLRVQGAQPTAVLAEGRPLRQVTARSLFETGTWLSEEAGVLLAYDPTRPDSVVELRA